MKSFYLYFRLPKFQPLTACTLSFRHGGWAMKVVLFWVIQWLDRIEQNRATPAKLGFVVYTGGRGP